MCAETRANIASCPIFDSAVLASVRKAGVQFISGGSARYSKYSLILLLGFSEYDTSVQRFWSMC